MGHRGKCGGSPVWAMGMHRWLPGTSLLPQGALHSGNCLKWSNWKKLGIFSIPWACFSWFFNFFLIFLMVFMFFYLCWLCSPLVPAHPKGSRFCSWFMRANLGTGGSHWAEPVWDEQKGKEQNLPSPQDCHQGPCIVYLPKRKGERDC